MKKGMAAEDDWYQSTRFRMKKCPNTIPGQSMEVRRIQEMAQQQIDFPQDFQHTSLKARSYTPSLDLGCHNVQGINVWANTAPRGWGSSSKDLMMPLVV